MEKCLPSLCWTVYSLYRAAPRVLAHFIMPELCNQTKTDYIRSAPSGTTVPRTSKCFILCETITNLWYKLHSEPKIISKRHKVSPFGLKSRKIEHRFTCMGWTAFKTEGQWNTSWYFELRLWKNYGACTAMFTVSNQMETHGLYKQITSGTHSKTISQQSRSLSALIQPSTPLTAANAAN